MSDISFHRIGYSSTACAAINVKIHTFGAALDAEVTKAGIDHGGDRPYMPSFAAFVAELPENDRTGMFDLALEDGWTDAKEIALETFGRGYGVTSEGRSNGWLIVTYNGRPTFDREAVAEWEADDRAKWEGFERAIGRVVEDIPYQYGAHLYRLYEEEADRRQAAADFAGPDPFGLETIGAAPLDAFGKPREVYYLVRVTDIEAMINAKSAEMAEAKLRGFLAGLRGRPGIVTYAGLTVETIKRS